MKNIFTAAEPNRNRKAPSFLFLAISNNRMGTLKEKRVQEKRKDAGVWQAARKTAGFIRICAMLWNLRILMFQSFSCMIDMAKWAEKFCNIKINKEEGFKEVRA